MYPQEVDYIVTGIGLTIICGIFGPTAIIIIWLMVLVGCINYRAKIKKYNHRFDNAEKRQKNENG